MILSTWLLNLFFVLSLLFCSKNPLFSQNNKNEFLIATGVVENAFTKVTINQEGFPKKNLYNGFKTRPLNPPMYYDIRYIRWCRPNFGLGAELIHHKLYYVDTTPEIARFDITNGFNLLYFDQALKLCRKKYVNVDAILGEGLVITHPESTLRGLTFSERGGIRLHDTDGYFISGATVQTSLKGAFQPCGPLSLTCEGKGTYSFATVPVARGTANVWNIAFHLTFGGSIRF